MTAAQGLWRELCRHFPARAAEWALAAMAAGHGLVLLAQQAPPDAPAGYGLMRTLASEPHWGWAALAVGLARLWALVINGAFRPSPYIRAATAFVCVGLWTAISLGIMGGSADAIAMPLAAYPVIALLDVWNVYRAMHDGGCHGEPA